jgi:photosystem II stability/assembly factor-like uncharacterized protein
MIRRIILLLLCTPFLVIAQDNDPWKDENFSGLKMRSVGPALMAGRIADIAIHPEDESIWYVAVGSGGVWKTENNGITWNTVFDNYTSYSTGCITIDPNNPNTVWLGTGENVGGRHVGYGDGIYRSDDGGASWKNMGLKESEHISKIIVHPSNPDKIWVAVQGPLWNSGGERGVYLSEDGGQTWNQTLGDDEWVGATDLLIDQRNPDRLYAATWQRHRTVAAYLGGGPGTALHRSEDGGQTWTKLEGGLPKSNMGKIGLALSPQDPDVIYAAIELDHREGGIFVSENRGASWEKRSDAVSGATGPHYYQELYASPHKEGRIYLLDVRVQISEDAGRTFRRMNERFKHSDNHAMAFRKSDPNYLLFGTDGGLYESFDLGENWRFISNMPITQFYKLAVDDAKPFYNIIGGTQDNSTQAGPSRTDNYQGIQNSDWRVILGGDGHQPATEPGNPNIVYGQSQEGFLSRVDMATGEVIGIMPQPEADSGFERYNWDAPIFVSPHKPSRIYHGSHRLWRSEDRGDNWIAVSGDLTRDQERIEQPIMGRQQSWDNAWDFYAMSTFNTITSISESPVQENLIYVGTDDGLIQVTEDGGKNWTEIDVSRLPKAPKYAYVNDIKADLYDANTVYVALDAHKMGDYTPLLYKSTNRGKSWVSISANLPERHLVWRLVQDHVNEDLLFIGTEYGIYFSVDGGGKWIKLKGGMPVIPVRDLTIQRRENDLVAATFGRSFYVFDDIQVFRNLADSTFEQEANLFPTRKTWWYIPRSHLGFYGKKSSQGEAHYVADNPEYGAVFTYYLKDSYQTAAAKRKEEEKELGDEENIPFPGWDAIATEESEQPMKIWLSITDKNGNLIRKVPAATSKGFHRTAWDLRYASPSAVSLNQSEPRGRGVLVAPGTYYGQLQKEHQGKIVDLTKKVPVELTPLHQPSLNNPRGAKRSEFLARYDQLARDYTAFTKALGNSSEKQKAIQTAYEQASVQDEGLSNRIYTTYQRQVRLENQVRGNSAKRKVGEKTKPTISDRFYSVSSALGASTYGPTTTAVQSLAIVNNELKAYQAELTKISEEQAAIAAEIIARGGPRVEGF